MIRALLACLSLLAPAALAADEPAKPARPDNTPPDGFVALFNGKDLNGWTGLMAGPLDSPAERAKATPERLVASQREADEDMRKHWAVQDGVIVFDGKGRSLATA